LTISIN
jgi:hypothetical protein